MSEEYREYVRWKMRQQRIVPNEVRHGRWIAKDDRAKQEIFICSECNGWAYSPWIGSRKNPKPNRCKYQYCPNCGAKMDEVNEDE